MPQGLNEKAAQGIYPTHAPLGYLNAQEPGTKRKIIVPDPARAHLVKELFERYASGLESYQSLTKWAKKNGLVSKKNKPLPKSAIEQILKHPAYCGIIRWNGKESVGIHEPLVSREVWNRAKDVREGRFNGNAGFGKLDFAYRGLLKCKCGDVMSGELKKGKYVYYHCTGRKREICGKPYISESKITESFCSILETLKIPSEFLPWILEGLASADTDRKSRKANRETQIRIEIEALKKQLEQIYLDKVSGDVSSAFYKETSKKWEGQILELQLEEAAIDRTEGSSIDQTMQLLELASTAHLRFKSAHCAQKRELVNLMCSNCSWIDGKLVVELREFFDLMLNGIVLEACGNLEDKEQVRQHLKSVEWWRIGGSNP